MYPSYEEIRGEMRIRGLEGLIPDVYVCAVSTSVNELGLCGLVRRITKIIAPIANGGMKCRLPHIIPAAFEVDPYAVKGGGMRFAFPPYRRA